MGAKSQGLTCNTSTALTLDGICRTYTSVLGSGQSDACSQSGQGSASWFNFTTNNAGHCVDIEIVSNPAIQMEVTLYTGNCNNNPLTPHSVCILDGNGHFARDFTSPLAANTKYSLRIRAPGTYTGTYTICARNVVPTNNLCSGAIQLDANFRLEHNCCNAPTVEVFPVNLCASTIENTAFYSYITATNGASIITLKNINCDNNDPLVTSAGFQVGFFTGSCGSLVYRACQSGLADGTGFAQYTSPVFPAGTRVYVGIDGLAGSNCEYEINASNAIIVDLRVDITPNIVRVRNSRLTEVAIYSIDGKRVYYNRGTSLDIPTSGYFEGMYIIQTFDGRFIKSYKFVK